MFTNNLLQHDAINETGDVTRNISETNCESTKTAVRTFRTHKNIPYSYSTSKSTEQSSSNIDMPTSSRRFNRLTPSEKLFSSREYFQSMIEKQADAAFVRQNLQLASNA